MIIEDFKDALMDLINLVQQCVISPEEAAQRAAGLNQDAVTAGVNWSNNWTLQDFETVRQDALSVPEELVDYYDFDGDPSEPLPDFEDEEE